MIPEKLVGIKLDWSTTFRDIHEITENKFFWINIPQQRTWFGVNSDGTKMSSETINGLPDILSDNAFLSEVDIFDLHTSQLDTALVKSLIIQKIGLENYRFDIHPELNLIVDEHIRFAFEFVNLVENREKRLCLIISIKDTEAKLDGEGLLTTNQRFTKLSNLVSQNWPENIQLKFGNSKLIFENAMYQLEGLN